MNGYVVCDLCGEKNCKCQPSELTEQEIKELSNDIANVLGHFMKQGMTSMSQLDICHTCGKMKLYCKCVDCNCINCKREKHYVS